MPNPKFAVGKIINTKNRVLNVLGEGGMGAVVKVKRLSNGSEAALKYCLASDPDTRKRFVREVRIMKQIKHPHVVSIIATGLKHDPPYFLMPLAEGNLRDEIANCTANHDLALNRFMELCEGVQAIHASGAVHRDIKPDNALIVNGKVVVSDLGLAKLNDRDTTILTQTNAIVGTMMYLAPEQTLPEGSRHADARTDIFQLGKTLYQLITGDDPVLLDMNNLPGGIGHIVRKATQQHPNERYQTVGQLMDAVKAYQRGKDPDADPIRAYEAIIGRVKENAARDRYDADDTQMVLSLLADARVQADNEQFLELFDQLPTEVLRVVAENDATDFQPAISKYVEAIDETVSKYSFSYAESIARRMGPIVTADRAPSVVKAKALEAILLGCVRLNRFAAIESFNILLKGIKDDGDAIEVAGMLRGREREYKQICCGVPSLKIHPTIRVVRDEFCPFDFKE